MASILFLLLAVGLGRGCGGLTVTAGSAPSSAANATTGNRCTHFDMMTQNYMHSSAGVNAQRRWLDLPSDCFIRNATVENARTCASNVKIAFFGDSISRDLGHALVEFLNGRDFGQMTEDKYDKKFTFADYEHMCICRDDVEPFRGLKTWGRCKNESCAHGTRHSAQSLGQTWEVTVYTESSYGSKESFPNLYNIQKIMEYDLVILGNTGLHGINKNIPAYPYVFFQPLLQFRNPVAAENVKSTKIRPSALTLPFVYLLPNIHHDELKKPMHGLRRQSYLVDYINTLFHDFSAQNHVPYFDTGIISQSSQACADEVHISTSSVTKAGISKNLPFTYSGGNVSQCSFTNANAYPY